MLPVDSGGGPSREEACPLYEEANAIGGWGALVAKFGLAAGSAGERRSTLGPACIAQSETVERRQVRDFTSRRAR
jgi:hypothetical protein